MVFGLALYVIYRRGQGKPLRKRFTIPAEALQRGEPRPSTGASSCPCSASRSTTTSWAPRAGWRPSTRRRGRAARCSRRCTCSRSRCRCRIDARVPDGAGGRGEAGARAGQGGGGGVRGRGGGHGHGPRAHGGAGDRRRGPAARGGGHRPGRRGAHAGQGRRASSAAAARARDRFVGETTRYVVEKAPCKVILTAAPDGPGRRARRRSCRSAGLSAIAL